ncbi:hypothetical protein CRE_21149 [Caenorhabditis remanei]|uniref:Uncharacterized protein n=1 Tax=Caenorhabditis remanei TaxID=31234 RepID=E3MF00_CAERE|nr:hypothetical protein CRE_21149 [Caenorhabditis remanei]
MSHQQSPSSFKDLLVLFIAIVLAVAIGLLAQKTEPIETTTAPATASQMVFEDEIAAKISRWNCVQDVPKHLWDKWTPDPTRFQGVNEFLFKTGTNGTELEEILYFHRLKMDRRGVSWIPYNSHAFNQFMVGAGGKRVKFQGSSRIENGEFHYHFQFEHAKKGMLGLQLVYFIPHEYLI